jgi:ribonucleoside-triphosphate reductase
MSSKSQKKNKQGFLPDIEPSCPCCGSEEVIGISRVVGYFSVIENWNESKKSELKRRQKGRYWTDERI